MASTSSTSALLQKYRLPTTLPPYLLSIPFLLLGSITYRDYSAWYALGRGGVPHNFFGYSIQGILQWVFGSKDLESTACFDKIINKEKDDFVQRGKTAQGQGGNHDNENPMGYGYGRRGPMEPVESRSWLPGGELPMRKGQKPAMGKWAVPQRMTSEKATEDLHKACRAFIDTLAAKNPTLLTKGPSQIECGSPALFLSPALPAPFVHDLPYPTNPPSHHHTHPGGPSELFHVHEAEGSMHALVSAAGAKEIASKGWGIRHALAGKNGTPWGYMLIYAPRDMGELDVIKKIVGGAVGYALEGRGGELKWTGRERGRSVFDV